MNDDERTIFGFLGEELRDAVKKLKAKLESMQRNIDRLTRQNVKLAVLLHQALPYVEESDYDTAALSKQIKEAIGESKNETD